MTLLPKFSCTFFPPALALLAVVLPVAHAQQAAPGSMTQQTEPAAIATPPASTPPEMVKALPQAESAKPLSLATHETLLLRELLLPDEEPGVKAELERITKPYLNQQLDMAGLNEMAALVTRSYRRRGYLVARAYFPPQDASDGVVELRVALGTYGNFNLKNQSRLRDSVVGGYLDTLRKTAPRSASLERTVLLLREQPGGAMPNVTLAPGQAPGTTDVQLELKREGRQLQGYLLGDNQGSRFTGRTRAFGELAVNSPLGLGDRFTVSGMMSDGLRLHNLRVAYEAPLNASGLRLSVATTRTRYALGGSYATLGATGSVKGYEGTLSYPLLRRHDSNLDLALNVAYRELHDNMSEVAVYNPRIAEVGTASVRRSKFSTLFGHAFYTTSAATLTVGQMNLDNATEIKSTDTNGDYAKLLLVFTGETPLTAALSVKGSLAMQKNLSTRTLDSSEQFFLSGSSGVRAYVEGASGQNGFLGQIELPWTLPAIRRFGMQHTVSLLADSGGVRAQKDRSSLTDFVLNDVGMAYTVTRRPVYLKLQGVQMLGNQRSEPDRTRMWLQVGMVF